MSRKAKIKVKRGKVKFKFKTDGDVLLHKHDAIASLLGGALIAARAQEAPTAQLGAGATRVHAGKALTSGEHDLTVHRERDNPTG